MDPLSDVCLSLSIKDLVSGQLHIGGRWAMKVPAYRDVVLSASLKGSFWVSINGLHDPILIEEGDCYLLANRLGYRTSSEPEMEAADLHSSLARANPMTSWPTYAVTQHRSGCDNTMFGVRLLFEESANVLFDLLPPIIHVRAKSDIAPVFRSMLHLLAGESAVRQIGATVMTNHLVCVLLVQALRAHIALKDHPHGWLGALVDAKIGAALGLMHRDSARQWTVEDLAAAVGMSRSSFALRFKTVVGQAPLDYWLQWRMHRAGHILRNSNRTVSSVAFTCGYESEKSFSKAFKRVMGSAPTSYRMADRMRPLDSKRGQVA
jgi:AraC-like DNA-binding protein